MEDAFLIVGLGNPGRKYENTRHNAGFMLVDHLARQWKQDWNAEKKLQSIVARGTVAGQRVFLCKPQTFMNESGQAVGAVSRFYRVPLERILVSVDDADLPVGTIRMRGSGSSGGHHGLESIEKHLGSRNFVRQKLGIGRRRDGVRQIAGHVLGTFSETERAVINAVLERAANQVDSWMAEGTERAMSLYNGAVASAIN